MSQIFLTSAIDKVMGNIATHLPKSPSQYKVAFIPTAAEAEDGDHWWTRVEKECLEKLGFVVEEFSITRMKSDEIMKKLADKQVIFVGGGDTEHLYKQMIKTGFDKVLRRKLSEGIIYIGSSAGSKVMGTRIDGKKSLKIVDFAILPHWGDAGLYEEYKNNFVKIYTTGFKIICLTNNQYLWFDGEKPNYVEVTNK